MSGVVPVHECGPITYSVAATKVVTGGQLVEAVAGGTVQPAAANSTKVLGVATRDARAADGGDSGNTTYGQPFVDTSYPPPRVAVAHEGTWKLTYAAAANFGDRLVAAANGQVTVYNSAGGNTPDMIIGQCRERGNVAAGATGETLLKLS